MTAVITKPTSTARRRLAVSFSRISFMRPPATVSRLADIICMPYRNSARPPSRESAISKPIVILL